MVHCVFVMAVIYLLFFVFILSQDAVKAKHDPLGKGIVIYKKNILVDQMFDGSTIFADVPEHCYKTYDVSSINKFQQSYSNTKQLYQSTIREAELSLSMAKDFTLGATLDGITRSVSETKRDVSGMSLNIFSLTDRHLIKKDCINEGHLTSSVKKNYESLPKSINKPWLSGEWQPYQNFLNKYGSHVVVSMDYGSSIYQYAFGETSSRYSEREFTVKACISLAGSPIVQKIVELKIEMCANITEDEIRRVTQTYMTSTLVIKGGKASTRAALQKKRTAELIEQFMQEAQETNVPVKYTFVPIWEVLQQFYIGEENFVQAVNLEAYYKGYLNFDCSYQKADSGIPLRRFIYAPESTITYPIYQCVIPIQGCHTDDDCHFHPTPYWCSCNGDSCIRQVNRKLDTNEVKPEAQVNYDDDYAWQGCSVGFFSCSCAQPTDANNVIWYDDHAIQMKSHHTLFTSLKNELKLLKGRKKKTEL